MKVENCVLSSKPVAVRNVHNIYIFLDDGKCFGKIVLTTENVSRQKLEPITIADFRVIIRWIFYRFQGLFLYDWVGFWLFAGFQTVDPRKKRNSDYEEAQNL